MKIKKLEIHNLASIGHAEIDFEHGELAGETLFLITGPTGAGKTTILDAICLALYDDTPRMTGANEKNECYTEVVNSARGRNDELLEKVSLQLGNKGQLLRRGTYEGWVNLTFEAGDINYEATWSISRSNQRSNGKLQSSKHTLKRLSDLQVWSKKAEVAAMVEQLTGLSFEEFCRTTMLAQGEFSRFLQSKKDEKSSILETLTHTEIYTKLGKKIHELKNQREEDYKRAEEGLRNIRPLTDEEISQYNAEIERLSQEHNGVGSRIQHAFDVRQWMETDVRLKGRAEQSQKTLSEQRAVIISPEYLAEKADIADFALTIQPRTWLDDIRAAIKRREQLTGQQSSFTTEYGLLAAAIIRLQADQTAEETRLAETQAWLDSRKADAAMLTNVGAVEVRLRQVSEYEASLIQITSKREKSVGQVAVSEEAIHHAEENERQAFESETRQKQQVDDLSAAIARMDSAGVQRLREELQRQTQSVNELSANVRLLEEVRKRIDLVEKDYKAEVEDKQRLEAALPEQEEEQRKARENAEEAQLIYDQWHESLEKSFKTARSLLRKNDTCPLCQQKIEHDHVPDPDYETVLGPIFSRRDEYQKKLNEATARLEASRRELKKTGDHLLLTQQRWEKEKSAFDRQLERVRQSYLAAEEMCEASVSAAGAQLRDEAAVNAGLVNVQQLDERARVLLTAIDSQMEKVRAKEEEIRQAQQQLEVARKRLEELSKKSSDSQKKTLQARHQLTLLQNRIADLDRQMSETNRRIEEAKELLRQQITYPGWEEEWDASHDAFITRLKADGQQYAETEKTRAKLAQTTESRKTLIANVVGLRDSVEERAPFVTQGQTATGARVDEGKIVGRWQKLFSDVTSWKTSMEETAETLNERRRLVDEFLGSHPAISQDRLNELAAMSKEEVDRTERRHRSIEDDIKKLEGELANIVKEQEQHQARRPEIEEGTTIETLSDAISRMQAEQQQLATQIGTLKATLEENRKTVLRHEQALAERDRLKAEWDKWMRFHELFGNSDGNKFRTIAQSFILHHLLQKANIYLRQFTDRFELTCQAGSITILVKDNYSNQTQYIKVLSGGESFMVSLSLSLALAQLRPNQKGVDIIFIDEGFGTLDKECLNAVMDTLERLHQMGGRRVALISHVEALNERIQAQIQVSRVDPSRSEVKVVRN